jgi:hypothetical protein
VYCTRIRPAGNVYGNGLLFVLVLAYGSSRIREKTTGNCVGCEARCAFVDLSKNLNDGRYEGEYWLEKD